MNLKLTSTTFTHDGEIPTRHTCEGEDVSPPLGWLGAPAKHTGKKDLVHQQALRQGGESRGQQRLGVGRADRDPVRVVAIENPEDLLLGGHAR